jgi:hypothetical protein
VRKYTYRQGIVAAAWLCRLRETKWVAVGNGDLVTPDDAVIRTAQTETLYSNDMFVCDLKETDVKLQLASELKLITVVRAKDLVIISNKFEMANWRSNIGTFFKPIMRLPVFAQTTSMVKLVTCGLASFDSALQMAKGSSA